MVLALRGPDLNSDGSVVLVDARRVRHANLGGSTPVRRDVHGALNLYLRNDLAHLLPTRNIDVGKQRISHSGQQYRPKGHRIVRFFNKCERLITTVML